MDSNGYQKLALKTESVSDGALSLEESVVLPEYLEGALRIGVYADKLKRSIFYGKHDSAIQDVAIDIDEHTTLTIEESRMVHCVLGLVSESGESAEALYRSLVNGEEFDNVNFMEEMGDLLWYIAIGLNAAGVTMQQAMDSNIAKLKKRYPDGFRETDAVKRDMFAERQALALKG